MPITPPDFLRNIMRQLPKIEDVLLETIVKVEAENMWAENFRNEGFTDVALTKWQPRKKPETQHRALLVKSGIMKGHALKGRKVGKSIDFVFPLDYMKVHNEGGHAGRGAGFQMPKRQFIGESQVLNQRIIQKCIQYLNHTLK